MEFFLGSYLYQPSYLRILIISKLFIKYFLKIIFSFTPFNQNLSHKVLYCKTLVFLFLILHNAKKSKQFIVSCYIVNLSESCNYFWGLSPISVDFYFQKIDCELIKSTTNFQFLQQPKKIRCFSKEYFFF
jgi:hypothetical protein